MRVHGAPAPEKCTTGPDRRQGSVYNHRPLPPRQLIPDVPKREAGTDTMGDPSAGDDVRVDLLKRLAEQAMSDPDFREVARNDLAAALATYGYDLNERELALVSRFRATLADAGVDLDLVHDLPEDQLARLLER